MVRDQAPGAGVAVTNGVTPLLAFAAGSLGAAGLVLLLGGREPRRRERALPPLLAAAARLAPRRLRPTIDLVAKLEAAGEPAGLTAGDLMAAKAGAALTTALAAPLFASGAPGRLGALLVIAAPPAAFLAPDFWLTRRARTRADAARRELPYLLDLLAVAVEAGLPPAAAMAAVGERGTSPLAAEWVAVGRQTAVGVPLETTLNRMTRRLPMPATEALRAAVTRSARHGSPLAGALASQARDARALTRRRIEEQAAKAAPKIQLVVALLLVPSVLLLIAAALLASFLTA